MAAQNWAHYSGIMRKVVLKCSSGHTNSSFPLNSFFPLVLRSLFQVHAHNALLTASTEVWWYNIPFLYHLLISSVYLASISAKSPFLTCCLQFWSWVVIFFPTKRDVKEKEGQWLLKTVFEYTQHRTSMENIYFKVAIQVTGLLFTLHSYLFRHQWEL